MPDDERPPLPSPEDDLAGMVALARAICYGASYPRVSDRTMIVALARTVVHLGEDRK